MKSPGSALVCLLVLTVGVAQAQQKRVYIAPDDHTDYWWSATESDYTTVFLDTLDYYLDLSDATDGNPSPYQSRWNCDGSFWLWTYEHNRTPAQFQRLIERIADGHISVPLNALCVTLGGAPAEAVLRGMYYPGQIEREHDVRFRLAYMIENQTQPFGLWALWAGSGARYSWKGICGCDTQVPDAADRQHDIYRAIGPDGSGMLVKWNSMLWGNQSMGGYAEARSPATVVDQVTANAPFNGFEARYPYDVIGCFGKGWDDIQTQTDEFITVAEAMTDANRQVIVSNEEDFFVDFEAVYGAVVPTQSVTYGNEWELYCAAMAETSARIKRAVEKLRTAEALATLVSLFDPTFMSGREAARDLAWMNLGLYWEHDFGMAGFNAGHPWMTGRIAWQHRITDEIEAYVNTLHDDAVTAFGELVPDGGSGTRFYVFNPLSWTRTDYADLAWIDAGPVHVVDVTTQIEVPSQLVIVGGNAFLRVVAADVPSVGYRVFEVVPGEGTAFSDAAIVSPGGPGPTTVVYSVASDDRDATSVAVGAGPHEVRVSGYSGGEPHDFVGADSEEETAAMAFAVDLPAGTSIQNAYVTVRAGFSQSASPTGTLAIRMYDVADTAAPFVDGAFGDLLGHHPTLPQTVFWAEPNGWAVGTDHVTPNLSSLVQTFIDRPDYTPGSHVGFVITEGTIATGRYYGWEDSAAGGAAPTLTIEYSEPSPLTDTDSLVMENDAYRVTVSPRGAITSLIDKTHGDREFVRSIGGYWLNDLGPSTGSLTVEEAGPVSVTVVATASSPVAHVTRVTMHRDSDRIEISNEITENFDSVQQWRFGFELDAPDVRHEEVGAIIRAKLVADGGRYAGSGARYDWLTLNHFADMSGGGDAGITLSNADCYFMRLGNSSAGFLDTITPQISVLAGGRVVSGGNGIPTQGGDDHFTQRFAMRTHDGYDQSAAVRLSLEHQNPLIAGTINGADPRLSGTTYSAVTVDNPDLLLWTLKPAEEGIEEGVIARLWNTANAPRTASVQFHPYDVQSAIATTHIETDEQPHPVVSGAIITQHAGQQFRTFRLRSTAAASGIPAVSAWGIVVMALLALTAGTLLFDTFRRPGAPNRAGHGS